MNEPAYTFDVDGMRKLTRDHYELRRMVRDLIAELPAHTLMIPGIYIAKSGGAGIPARVGNKPGEGTVTIYRIDKDYRLQETGQTERVLNLSGEEVAGEKYLQLVREIVSGELLVNYEDCSDA